MSKLFKVLLVFVLALTVGVVLLTSASTGPFTPLDKAYYASQKDQSFVRPGLTVTIVSAEIATDGTTKARVKFTDPDGRPLDKDGITTAGRISNGAPSAIVAFFDTAKNEFTSYTTRTQVSNIRPGQTAIQAGADSGGVWEKVAEGEYTYTFRTKAPTGFNRSAVHAIGVYANRILTDYEMGTQLDDDVYYFTPNNGQKTSNPRDIIRTATCQKCHGPNMAFHGEGGRTSMQMCDLCHTSQTIDPDTGNTVDMETMTHKIHMGEHLPSVVGGTKYVIYGNRDSLHDYSEVVFPSPVQSCETCHENNRGAAKANAWITTPTRAACGACHDDVNFETGDKHAGLPQPNDAACARCHVEQTNIDFDLSIRGAHVIPQESKLLTGLQWGIEKVEDGAPGKKPTVTFTVKDKDGNGLPMSAIARVALTLAGPTYSNYSAFGKGYVQEDAIKAEGSNGRYTYTFKTAIPADATGTFAVGLEGRRVEKVLVGTRRERSIQYGAVNPVMYFSVDGSPLYKRDEPTSNAQCLACHTRLALHGENRVDNVEYCVMCHNPVETDASRRPAAKNPPETIDMKFMTHRIHGGESLHEEHGVDYTVYGYGGNPISFSHVRYPSPLQNCSACHQAGSENPRGGSEYKAKTNAARYPMNPMPLYTAGCYGCHAENAMLSHARTNTNDLGESCSVCHSSSGEFAPTKMHAAELTVNRDQASK
jgi:OmcA/MtrC family decaheme c-type cytochrome